jgi:hypothetical protein
MVAAQTGICLSTPLVYANAQWATFPFTPSGSVVFCIYRPMNFDFVYVKQRNEPNENMYGILPVSSERISAP